MKASSTFHTFIKESLKGDRLLLILSLLLFAAVQTVCKAETVRQGNSFIQVDSKTSSTSSVYQKTIYTYTTTKGDKYPIYINTKNGACYIFRISKQTGKEYKQKLSEDISKQISLEMGIPFKKAERN